jgi:hypothetical protein
MRVIVMVIDPSPDSYPCPSKNCQATVDDISTHCSDCGKQIPACVVTGRSLIGGAEVWTCRLCKHRAGEREIVGQFACCPLCHTPLVTTLNQSNEPIVHLIS